MKWQKRKIRERWHRGPESDYWNARSKGWTLDASAFYQDAIACKGPVLWAVFGSHRDGRRVNSLWEGHHGKPFESLAEAMAWGDAFVAAEPK